MARKVRYTYKNETKEILFSFREFHGPHEAAAAAEGVNIAGYHDMLTQVEMASTSVKGVKDFRHNYFAKLGFSDIGFVKEEKGTK
ncbi:DUF2960 domain-containing protein [Vibrio sp. Of7-15]|uniref:DUF2960 domain-containing protein n=1 Tax=Vibrio sp. Of7-15 TaxID=2724879 RepID=UPI001EF33E42|nr:DUF2960 domain-containing protein [Vibrio sp. Of7-15]MCG7495570.1 DUF2960 domain-containing protein [Vibrio sp. Of7-15]